MMFLMWLIMNTNTHDENEFNKETTQMMTKQVMKNLHYLQLRYVLNYNDW